jgi:hypothetical protein
LFTVFGVFGAISVYLTTLINVKNSNGPINGDFFKNQTLYYFPQNTNSSLIDYFKECIILMINHPSIILQYCGLTPSTDILLNIAVISSLTLFIIIGC